MKTRYARAMAYALAALSLAGSSSLGWAEEETRMAPVTMLPKFKQECASCHVAYPPGMLPAESWRRILGNLDHHFGSNASLDEASVKELTCWLTAHAASGGRAAAAPPQDRITRSAWFLAAHDEVPPSAWRLPAVKGASNCAACHTRANEGNFDERFVRIPR